MPERAPNENLMIFLVVVGCSWMCVWQRAPTVGMLYVQTITLISEEGAIMSLVLPTTYIHPYIADTSQDMFFFRRDILRRDQYFMSTFHIQIVDISSPFWLNDEISETLRYF